MLEENHNLEKIIEDAKQYRWYSVPDMYMVEILDTTGRSAGFVQSIFIDKKEGKWQKGDVIYFESYDQNIKDFGMIVQEPISGKYSVVSLNGVPGVLSGDGYFSDQANIQYKEINRMIESFKDLWDCVEKVNAHLVVED
ncbi:MAG: hypothetical protein E7G04_07210 [Lactobacillus gasseri]|nr:hypothetical protein [Lactobacillus gasseri]